MSWSQLCLLCLYCSPGNEVVFVHFELWYGEIITHQDLKTAIIGLLIRGLAYVAERLFLLVREEFIIWKSRIEHFLSIYDAACWRSVRFGPHVPMSIPAEGGVLIPKAPSKYSDDDLKKIDRY